MSSQRANSKADGSHRGGGQNSGNSAASSSRSQSTQRSLTQVESQQPQRIRCKATDCRFISSSIAQYNHHITTHANYFQCGQCSAYFLSRKALYPHFATHGLTFGQVNLPRLDRSSKVVSASVEAEAAVTAASCVPSTSTGSFSSSASCAQKNSQTSDIPTSSQAASTKTAPTSNNKVDPNIRSKIKCIVSDCPSTFTDNTKHFMHFKAMHNTLERCDECLVLLSSKDDLYAHTSTHLQVFDAAAKPIPGTSSETTAIVTLGEDCLSSSTASDIDIKPSLKEISFRCPVLNCRTAFPTIIQRDQHYNHGHIRLVRCWLCKTLFTTRDQLEKHYKANRVVKKIIKGDLPDNEESQADAFELCFELVRQVLIAPPEEKKDDDDDDIEIIGSTVRTVKPRITRRPSRYRLLTPEEMEDGGGEVIDS